MSRKATVGPAAGKLHGTLHLRAVGRVAHTLVELHADVRAQALRDGHVVLGRPEDVLAVVVVSTELHAAVGKFDEVAVGEDLEASRIGEDGLVPVHELVHATKLGDGLRAGTHLQVVGVVEHDLGAQGGNRVGQQALDGAFGANGHKDGRVNVAVGGVEDTGPGMRAGILGENLVGKQLRIAQELSLS